MSRAKGRKSVGSGQLPEEGIDMGDHVDKDLQDFLKDLEPPKSSRVLKDKAKKQKDDVQKAREAAKRKFVGSDSDEDAEPPEQQASAKRAKFAESRAAMKQKIKEHSGPPVFRRCLFPTEEVVDAKPELDAELAEKLPQLAKALLDGSEAATVEKKLEGSEAPTEEKKLEGSEAATQEKKLEESEAATELLLGGWTKSFFLQRDATLSEAVQHHLFSLVVRAADIEVARAAFDILSSGLAPGRALDQLLGRQAPLVTQGRRGFYGESEPKTVQCHLGSSEFLAALPALGYQDPGSVRAANANTVVSPEKVAEESAAATTPGPVGLPGWQGCTTPPRLGNLQLLLRLLAQVADLQAQGSADVLSGGSLQQLLIIILNLRMDTVCSLLASDLEGAARAVLDAFPEQDWARKFSDLAQTVAGLGGSHRGGVELIRLLPSFSERADLLRSHAAARLFSTLLLDKGKKPTGVTKSRGLPAPVDPEALVGAQSWYEGGEGYLRLAKSVNQNTLSIWELQSAIKLVDILLWPHVKAAREGAVEEPPYAAFMQKWRAFCQKLGTYTSKDDQGAALKLLITTISTRDNASSL